MLKILNSVSLKRATDAKLGNVQTFLERLLIEVTSENYRYFLTQHLSFRNDLAIDAPTYCWPPLLSNERQVSGLFAIGLSRVSPISNPEYPIGRSVNEIKRDEDKNGSRSGRIDFLAYYGNRHIALELKRHPISTTNNAKSNSGLDSNWQSVTSQAKQALMHMRSTKWDFESPVSVGLLIVRVGRTVTSKREIEDARSSAHAKLPEVAGNIGKLTKADFLAYYTNPAEMQVSYGWGKDGEGYSIFPGVVFAAVVHGSTKQAAVG